MDNKYKSALDMLKKYHQEHLIYFYDELTDIQKDFLLNQILCTDFHTILTLYKNSFNYKHTDLKEVSPLNHIEKNSLSSDELEYYTKIGNQELKNNTFAVVTMAGGQGSRLGYKGPKGTYMLDLKPNKKSLFQIMAEDILNYSQQYDIIFPWYIMTSEENDKQTKDFFETYNYFRLSKRKNNLLYSR